jgi:hypothetical protein
VDWFANTTPSGNHPPNRKEPVATSALRVVADEPVTNDD